MAIINLGCSIILTRWLGIIGVVIGTIISKIATFVWYDPFIVYKHVLKNGLMDYFKNYIQNWIFLIVVSIVSLMICDKIQLTGWLLIMADSLVVTVFVNFSYYLIFQNKPEFRELRNYLNMLTTKFSKKKSI